MSNLLALFNTLHSGRKSYLTAAALIAVGVGVLTGQVDSNSVRLQVGEVTFENVDERLNESPAPASGGSNDGLIGLIALLLGGNAAATRAAIGKATPRGDAQTN
jgi:hypothetical protein